MSDNQSAIPPLILVLGAGKSGTTALFFCLKASAERHFAMTFPFRFEPKSAAVIDAFPAEFGIAKMLLERYERTSNEFVSRFDKRVFILRDPRDNVISRLVYHVGTRLKRAEPQAREAITRKFLAKERDPESISVVKLFEAVDALMGTRNGAYGARKFACKPVRFFARGDNGFFRLSYEDFVDGRLDALQHYMGFAIRSNFEIAPDLRHVSRARSHGYWRNWFTEEDYDYFVKPIEEDLRRMGYQDLAPHLGKKTISPVEISEYLQRQLGN